jgi:hypothetical protein
MKNRGLLAAFLIVTAMSVIMCPLGVREDFNEEIRRGIPDVVPFSGAASRQNDSCIDLIWSEAGQTYLTVQLDSGFETVEFGSGDLDITGLVLTADTSPYNVTIDGHGRVVDLTGLNSERRTRQDGQGSDFTGHPFITVGPDITLTLRNITFKGLASKNNNISSDPEDVDYYHIRGDSDENNNTAPLILVEEGGTLIMENGVVLTENDTLDSGIGGVSVWGTFTMNGGEISRITNAVEVHSVGRFTMNNGTISNNTAMTSGAGVAVSGLVTMNSGTISDNKVLLSGGGVYLSGSGQFLMGGGTISGNEATKGGGVFFLNTSSAFLMSGGTISNNKALWGDAKGGAAYVYGTFSMQGGTISDNHSGNGGGLYINGGSFIIRIGDLSGNTAENGGGVYIASGIFKMEAGAVSNNKASTGNGGGVYVGREGGDAGTFLMSFGSISSNVAENQGGGVYVEAGSFSKSGGVINGDGNNLPFDPDWTGDDRENQPEDNTAKNMNGAGNAAGNAVFVENGPKYRDTTAGQGDNLDINLAIGWGI